MWIDRDHAVIDVQGGMGGGYLDGILMTGDGGRTWSAPAMRSATAGADGITGLPAFVDLQTGWLAGGAPGTRLWATRDGGQTWTLQHFPPPSGYHDGQGEVYQAPTFFNATEGVVALSYSNATSSDLVIYTTSDAGRTWRATQGSTPAAASWSFVSPDDWILWDSSNGGFSRSTDQGRTWSKPIAAIGLPSGGSPTMAARDHGWAIGGTSADVVSLYVTSDGGSTWVRVDPIGGTSPTPAPGLAPCQASALKAKAGRQGETGVVHGDVLLTNVGQTPCILGGAPLEVELVRTDGSPLRTDLLTPVPSPTQQVVLEPGVADAGWLIVYWANWCGAPPGPLQIRITLGGGAGTVSAPFTGTLVARCDAPDRPSTLQTEDFLPQ